MGVAPCDELGLAAFRDPYEQEWNPSDFGLYLLLGSCWCTLSLIMSSMRKMETAASVAKRNDFILLIAGSTTPAFRLSRTSPSQLSSPYPYHQLGPLTIVQVEARVLEVLLALDGLAGEVVSSQSGHQFGRIVGGVHLQPVISSL